MHDRQRGFAAGLIGLVEHYQHILVGAYTLQDFFIVLVEVGNIEQHANQVGVVKHAGCGAIHVAMDGFFPAVVDPGRIYKNTLVVIAGFYAQYLVASSLWAMRGDT